MAFPELFILTFIYVKQNNGGDTLYILHIVERYNGTPIKMFFPKVIAPIDSDTGPDSETCI